MPSETIDTLISLIKSEVKDTISNRVRGDRNRRLLANATVDLLVHALADINKDWENPTHSSLIRMLDGSIEYARDTRKLIARLCNKYDAYLVPSGYIDYKDVLKSSEIREIVYVSNMGHDELLQTLKKAKVKYTSEYNVSFPLGGGRTYLANYAFVVGKWVGIAVESYALSNFTALEMYEYIKRMKPDDYDMHVANL